MVPGQGRFASPNPVLLAHWIVHQDNNEVYSAPALADVDGDGREEICVGSFTSVSSVSLYKYSSGSVREVWSSPGNDGSVYYTCPLLADVNGDGVLDAVTPLDNFWNVKGLRVFSGSDGSVLWENSSVDTVNYSSPLLVGDSVVVVGNDGGKVYALRLSDGSTLWTYSTGKTIWSSPALGDVDGDGVDEIVITNETGLYVLETDGSLSWSANAGQWLTTPALSDLDGDGDLEMVLYDAEAGTLKAFDYGSSEPLWTADIEAFLTSWSEFPPSPAVGDVDADGAPEVVIGANNGVWCVSGADGSLEWQTSLPVSTDTLLGSPLLADLDGLVAPGDGGKLEVVLTGVEFNNGDGVIYLLDDGGAVRWRFTDTLNFIYPVDNDGALGDVDGDGELEIVSVDNSCFGVILDDTAQASVNEGTPKESLRAWASGGRLFLKGLRGLKVRVSLYDLSGRLAWRRELELSGGSAEMPLSQKGFVLVEAEGLRKVLRAF